MYKFYVLEDMTQDDLNKLAFERNKFQRNWDKFKSLLIDKIATSYDNQKYEEMLNEMIKIESGEKYNG